MTMSTMSFSVEDDTKRDFAVWAKRAKKSKSDLFRDMITSYRFNQSFEEFALKSDVVLKDLGIETDEELYAYLESDQTYADRIRQQRLLSSN